MVETFFSTLELAVGEILIKTEMCNQAHWISVGPEKMNIIWARDYLGNFPPKNNANTMFKKYLLCLTSLSMIISRSIHVAANGIISFFLMSNIPLYICIPCLLYHFKYHVSLLHGIQKNELIYKTENRHIDIEYRFMTARREKREEE